MKRHSASSLLGDAKRFRPDDAANSPESIEDPFHQELRKNVSELPLGDFEEPGYIHGNIRMKWGPRKAIQLGTEQGPIVECELRGSCAEHWDCINRVAIGDEVQIVLRGARVKKPGAGNKSSLLFTFSAGIIMKWVKARHASLSGHIIDTWRAREPERAVDPSDWYTTPPDPTTETGQESTSASHSSGDLIATVQSRPAGRLRTEPTADGTTRLLLTNLPSAVPVNAPYVSTSTLSSAKRTVTLTSTGSTCDSSSAPSKLSISMNIPYVNSMPAEQQASMGARPVLQSVDAISSTSAATHVGISELGMSAAPPDLPSRPDEKAKKAIRRRRQKETKKAKANAPVTKAELLPTDDDIGGSSAEHGQDSPIESVFVTTNQVVGTAVGIHGRNGREDSAVAILPLPCGAATSAHQSSFVASYAQFGRTDVCGPSELPTQAGDAGVTKTSVGQTAESLVAAPERQSLLPPSMTDVHHQIPPIASTSFEVMSKTEDSEFDIDSKWGFTSEYGTYFPLNRVPEGRPVNVAGVVISTGEVGHTSTGENKIKLTIVDPTNLEVGYSINAFSKKSHLPRPQKGDILLMRRIQGDRYGGSTCGTAPSYKEWVFALHDSSNGVVREADSKAEPNRRMCKATATELEYCSRLVEWWKTLYPKTPGADESNAIVHHIAPFSCPGRVHRLIRDASPYIEPSGFFDCTVEVLDGYRNDNGVHSLYVTDYTHNPALATVARDQYHPQLADRVLKIEMWNDAAARAQEMKPGEYYFIGNVRMKASAGGYIEGSFSEVNKLRKLDEDILEGEPHFVALLDRKQIWEAEVEESSQFEHRLFEEIEPNHHFHCTAEVIAISSKDDECTCLYVTDYTARPDLVPVSPKILRTPELKNRIVRIDLRSEMQVEASKNLSPGDFVFIRNLRLRHSRATTQLVGTLGGSERLLGKLQVNQTGNHALEALMRRKLEWQSHCDQRKSANKQKRKKGTQPSQQENKGKPSVSARPLKPHIPVQTVIDSDVCPSLFRIHARIVDFYPEKVEHFTVRRCSRCHDEIPSSLRICTRCDDAMSEHSSVKLFWEFFIRVEDDAGSRLDIAVSDEQCTLLANLPVVDFHEDPSRMQVLLDRVKPLFGDLLETDDDSLPRRRITDVVVPNTPMLALTIGSWSTDNSGCHPRSYVLQQHTSLA